MAKYHAHTSPSSRLVQTHSPTPLAKKFGLGKLAQHYGVMDMVNISESDNSCTDQSIDEECLAYTTTTFRSKTSGDVNILAFCEVSPYYLPCSLPDLMPCAIRIIEK